MNKMFINGVYVSASSGENISVLSPETGLEIAQIPRGMSADVDSAVAAARSAFNGEWGKKTATERGRILTKICELTLRDIDELAAIESEDTGKPLELAKADIKALARYFEFYGGAADKIHGETIPYLDGYSVSIVKEPCGVVAHIIPWNYPAQMLGRTIAPALTMGNTCVVKPAEEACLTSLRFAALTLEAGLPKGALNIVTGYGAEAGAALSSHSGINMLTFTGSPVVGRMIQESTANNHVRCVLELGGKCPQVVFGDANLDKAVPGIVNGILQNSGQTCSAGSRVLVEKKIYNEFVSRLSEMFNSSKVGPSNSSPTCGPIITRKQFEFVSNCVNDALSRDIPVIGKGKICSTANVNGNYVAPIAFGPVKPDDFLAKEEVFGPVLSVLTFESEEEAIELANSTEYGLVAGVWTENGARQIRVSKGIECGQVFINCYGAGGGVELPFGGVRKSGYGREKGLQALNEFCETKTVVNSYS
ncbi:aldehyde dehydrogenase family protein [Marinobacterium rhizophilum]|uniref:aldehyde dehydrogenase family protein n=1 Tax=Marinobacterium rhizophilum TaxID=420402 RepID=UPI0009FE9D28|nr:aldehyde dehydrogenase family protein [Marinobacterium rhizophilum]